MQIAINPQQNWNGYSNLKDITMLPDNVLIAGSQNVLIEDSDKVSVRAGADFFGAEGTMGVTTDQGWTLPHRIHSSYDDFVNNAGIKIPVRIYYSGSSAQADVVDAWFDGAWHQITGNTPTYKLQSTHEHYFAEFFDPFSLQNHLIFAFGQKVVGQWTGGAAKITGVTGTTITIDTPYVENGFIDVLNANFTNESANFVVVNGAEYVVTAGFTTNTITVASTTGISVGDYIFQGIRTDTIQNESVDTNFVADVCNSLKNQVYFQDWKQRTRLVSWNRNQLSSIGDVNYAGISGLNDLEKSGVYTGTSTATIKISIDSVPAAPVSSFTPATGGMIDDILVFTGIHTGSDRDTYYIQTTTLAPTVGVNCYKNGVIVATTTLAALYYTPVYLGDGIYIYTTSLNNGYAVGTTWTYEVGGQDTFSWYLNGVLQSPQNNPTSVGLTYLGMTFKNLKTIGHLVGDSWTINAYPAIDRGWRQVYFTEPKRLAGEGWKYQCDSNGWTMETQENEMYDVDFGGRYYTVKNTVTSDGETFSIDRLKSDSQNKPLYPYLMTHIKNYLATINQDKTYDILGRQQFLELPQTDTLSDNVRLDFINANWKNASMLYFKRKIYFSVPESHAIFVYDDFKKYWQAPQVFAKKIGRLAIIDDKLIGHSYEQNESYELFTGTNDFGFPIQTALITPYLNNGIRYAQKSCSAIGFEGYMQDAPEIRWRINFGIGGCEGFKEGVINPVLCIPPDRASLGKSNFGYHGLGNDPVDFIPHFFQIKTFAPQKYYLRNIELRCDSLDQRWSIVSLGTDLDAGLLSNSSITNRNTV